MRAAAVAAVAASPVVSIWHPLSIKVHSFSDFLFPVSILNAVPRCTMLYFQLIRLLLSLSLFLDIRPPLAGMLTPRRNFAIFRWRIRSMLTHFINKFSIALDGPVLIRILNHSVSLHSAMRISA